MELNNYNSCKFCKKKTTKLVSLKDYYFKCNYCNNIFRDNKKKKNIFHFFKNSSTLCRYFSEGKSKKNQYNYYLDAKKNDFYKNEKYFLVNKFINETKTIKDILDVSGAPGNVGYNISKNFKVNYDLTEFDEKISKHLYNTFKLNFYNLDFDNIEKNNIPKDKKYDFIIMFHCIYYSKNIIKLLELINSKLKKNGYLLIAQIKPNFAAITKSSIMEGYPPYVFYSSKFINNILINSNYSVITNKKQKIGNFINHYFLNFSNSNKLIYNFFSFFISCYYILLNSLKLKKDDLTLENYYLILKKNK